MKTVVIGLGNMGICVLAANHAKGIDCTGLDLDPQAALRRAGFELDVLSDGSNCLYAYCLTSNYAEAFAGDMSKLAIICVPTPVSKYGDPDYAILDAVCDELAKHLTERDAVICHSTIYPADSTTHLASRIPRTPTAYCPVFLRAGRGVHDYMYPARVIAGVPAGTSIDMSLVFQYFAAMGWGRRDPIVDVKSAPIRVTDYTTAECLKMWHNAWMATKVAFVNEMSRFAVRYGIDGATLADMLFSDTKALLSKSHLSPGQPYSGPCLSKDDIGLIRAAGLGNADLIRGVMHSNKAHGQTLINNTWKLAERFRCKPNQVGIHGMTFKPGYDDMRRSWALDVYHALVSLGWDPVLYDPILSHVPHEQYVDSCRGDTSLLSLESKIRGTSLDECIVVLNTHTGKISVKHGPVETAELVCE